MGTRGIPLVALRRLRMQLWRPFDGKWSSARPLDGSSPESALQELLGPLSSYSGEHVAQAAYEPDLVSLPEVAGRCDLASQLEGPDRDCLVSFKKSLLLREDAFTQRVAEEGLPTPHWDDALVGDVYISFESGMLTLSLGCRSQASIFFVRKKSGAFADDR